MQTEMKGGSNMETEQKSDTITISKNSLWKYSTFVLLGIIILGVAFYVLPGKSTTGNVIQQPGQNLPTEPTAKVQVDIDGDPVKGEASADVTFVEFTDYECPFCKRAFEQSTPVLDKNIESGKKSNDEHEIVGTLITNNYLISGFMRLSILPPISLRQKPICRPRKLNCKNR